jgi:hypothetical protein
MGILIFKGLTARRLYKSCGVKGLISFKNSRSFLHTDLVRAIYQLHVFQQTCHTFICGVFHNSINVEGYSLLPLTVFSHIGHKTMILISEHECSSSHLGKMCYPRLLVRYSYITGLRDCSRNMTDTYPFAAHM